MLGGEQQLSLGGNYTLGCWHRGLILHEFIHAFGFHHEQSRPDRDEYVEIIWDNIRPEYQNQFDIAFGTNTYGVPYDPNSVMHYGNSNFGNGGGFTMISKVRRICIE